MIMLKKGLFVLLWLILIGLITFICGPKVKFEAVSPDIPVLDYRLSDLDSLIRLKESKIANIKPDNHARIVWANDSLRGKTPISVVYLHGFTASQEEGDPLHENFAKRYGMNLYLPRLADHGIRDTNAMKGLAPSNLVESAAEAVAIGKMLGDEVILMSCSTGGTLSAYLAAHHEFKALIMYSPNIDIFDPMSDALMWPWGKQIADKVLGGDIRTTGCRKPEECQYWSEKHHTDGLFALQGLLEQTMTKDIFKKIEEPIFMGYYFKDRVHQDSTVSVEAMQEFFGQVATNDSLKRKVAFPDAGSHVISSRISNDHVLRVQEATYAFADEVLKL